MNWIDRISKKFYKWLSTEEEEPKHTHTPQANENVEPQGGSHVTEGQDPKTDNKLTHQEENYNNKDEEKKKLEDSKEICDLICKCFKGVNLNKNSKLVIWINTDSVEFQKYNELKLWVEEKLYTERGIVFDEIEVKNGMPEDVCRCRSIGRSDRVFLQIVEIQPVVENQPVHATVCRKAEISIKGDSGSLVKRKYVLSADDMENNNIAAYNIGIGKTSQYNVARRNHIIIDDNKDNPMFEKNKYVSTEHAHIGFSENFGFYLQVDPRGTYQAGKRTQILNHGAKEPIECNNTQQKYYLKNGDQIILSKSVILCYIEKNNY